MPRYSRQKSDLGIYHIIVRGVDRMNIFLDKNDNSKFLDTLRRFKEADNCEIYAYCLMSNHVHLLMKEAGDSIQRFMKRVGVSYVYYFNKKYDRVGHLFQDRYRSEAIDSEQYLLACARYIHNNPVAAGLVEYPEDYDWSSYSYYLGSSNHSDLLNKDFLLDLFSDDRDDAVLKLKEFTEMGNDDCFMECENNVDSTKEKVEAEKIITGILKKHNITLEELRKTKDKSYRNRILNELKRVSRFSVRELSLVLGISKDIIFRA
ncbi:MAG: REP-associated tyrosine transposase [Dethiobacteria bacterium]